jgi:hypothetical protein
MELIDEELEPTETSHKFFNIETIELAEKGDKDKLKEILTEFINDDLRR